MLDVCNGVLHSGRYGSHLNKQTNTGTHMKFFPVHPKDQKILV